MLFELAAPASLPLGLVQQNGQPALLTLTVQHPPIQLAAQAEGQLQITGPRAHLAHAYASQYLTHHNLARTGEIEIELAIPAFMGLSGDLMMRLAIAQTLAWAHGLPNELTKHAPSLSIGSEHASQLWGFQRGGLLLAGTRSDDHELPPIIRRATIAHPEREAWAFVFYLPSAPDETPERLEDDRLRTMLGHPVLPPGQVADEIFAAVAADDVAAFGQGIMSVQGYFPQDISSANQRILDIMQEYGVFACGQMLTGYGLWGLVKGGQASRELRKKISEHVGFFGGRVMATIADNRGASFVEKKGQLDKIALGKFISPP